MGAFGEGVHIHQSAALGNCLVGCDIGHEESGSRFFLFIHNQAIEIAGNLGEDGEIILDILHTAQLILGQKHREF